MVELLKARFETVALLFELSENRGEIGHDVQLYRTRPRVVADEVLYEVARL